MRISIDWTCDWLDGLRRSYKKGDGAKMARSNESDLTEKLAEGHRKYGDGNFTVQNIGDETNPNWTVVKM